MSAPPRPSRSCLLAFLVAALVALNGATPAAAQDPLSFDITSVTYSDDSPHKLELVGLARDQLARELGHLGLTRADSPQWTFFVGADKSADSDLVALSVVVSSNMPEPLVELGKVNEAFYLQYANRASLPAEGTQVRQSMSENYMRQFSSPTDHFVRIVEPDSLQSTLAEIAAIFNERHFARLKDEG
jgi:hypothetical protein